MMPLTPAPNRSSAAREWVLEYLPAILDGGCPWLPPIAPPADGFRRTAAAIERVRFALAEADTSDAQADAVRVLVTNPAGVPAPPYASWYLDGCLLGPATRWVEAEYAGAGLDLAPHADEPADYLGAELEYLFFLSRHEQAARAVADPDALASVRARERRFHDQHFSRWVPAFIAAVRDANPGDVLKFTADLLEAFLLDQRDWLAEESALQH